MVIFDVKLCKCSTDFQVIIYLGVIGGAILLIEITGKACQTKLINNLRQKIKQKNGS